MSLSTSLRALVLISLVLGLTRARGADAAPTIASSRIDRVVVYSDQAKVVRMATFALPVEEQEVAVADLPTTAVQDSVRVESKTAQVLRVDLLRSRERLPRQVKAEALIKKIEVLVDQIWTLEDERSIRKAELEFLSSLRPRTPPAPPEGKAAQPEGIFPDAWQKILAWVDGRTQKLRARLLAISSEEKRLFEKLHPLRVEATDLDPSSADEPVSRVVATIRGKPGRHAVEVSYLVQGAKWVPSYDLAYDHLSKTVEATYYAVVSQRTGEDWESARLEFSTGQPHTLVAIPEIPTILFGRQRDFTPTPRARLEPRPLVWTAPLPAQKQDASVAHLRVLLAEADRVTGRPLRRKTAPLGGESETDESLEADAPAKTPPKAEPAPEPKPAEDGGGQRHRGDEGKMRAKVQAEYSKRRTYQFEDDTITGSLQKPDVQTRLSSVTARAPAGLPAPTTVAAAPPPPREAPGPTSEPREAVPWTDGTYRPAPVDPDSPFAGAKGHLFTLAAPGRHRLASTGTSRRVPILRSRLRVDPIHRIVPGLSLSTYVLAELENKTGLPILRGNAHVFTASMFTGRSWLNTALPGQKLSLPLGVDDSVKVARRVQKRTQTRGILSREDTTDFTVEIEVANNRGQPITVEIEDQVPVKLVEKDKVEIRGFASKSFAAPDKKGKVIFKGKIPASSVKKLSFDFQVVRPKDWEVTQHDD